MKDDDNETDGKCSKDDSIDTDDEDLLFFSNPTLTHELKSNFKESVTICLGL